MRRPEALLADLGDTLLRVRPFDLASGVAAIAGDPKYAISLPGRGLADLVADLGAAIERIDATNEPGFTAAAWLSTLRPDAPPSLLEEMERDLRRRTVAARPMSGVEEALAALSREGVRLAVLSNSIFSSGAIEDELRRHGMGPFFEFVLSSADVGARKPDPKIFKVAASRLCVSPARIWFVGDSWVKDVEGSARAGMVPVWLNDRAETGGNDHSFIRARGWPEVLAAFREAEPGG